LKNLADKIMHPARQRGKTGLEIVPESLPVFGIIEN
jgi:hypothetical protein